MYNYEYKGNIYNSYYDVIRLEDFVDTSFPVEEDATADLLLTFGIIRTEVVPEELSLDEVKEEKKEELTTKRDAVESEPVVTDKGTFDFTILSQIRLSHAQSAMEDGAERDWTLKDGVTIKITKQDIQNILMMASVRSDQAYAKLQTLKAQVDACNTKEEVTAIEWGD